MKTTSLTIQQINEDGYGISFIEQTKYLIKNSLPQELTKIKLKDKINYYISEEISNPSSSRIPAKCKHFLLCGGCQLQHLTQGYYQDFKIQKVKASIVKAGYEVPNKFHYIQLPDYSRRKITISIDYNTVPVKIGFLQEFSNKVLNIEECVIATPQIFQIIKAIKQNLSPILKLFKVSQIIITSADSGMDLIFRNQNLFNLSALETLSEFSKRYNISRLSSHYNEILTLILENQPLQAIGKDYKIKLPLAYFIQATKGCEDIFKDKLNTYTQDARNIADLYSGFGTYSMMLAQNANVKSYEISDLMVKALNESANLFLRKFSLQAFQRDLEKKPLLPLELSKFDHIIINPPRKGALPQIKEIANSTVNKVTLISCNPTTFGRDIYYLKQAGYLLKEITIIDQFLYNSHAEILALFAKS